MSRSRRLRSGYTTGACAAAAAKAAAAYCRSGERPDRVEIPFPDGSRVWFTVYRAELEKSCGREFRATASVIKDAGDDPDVTNGAEIVAGVRLLAAAVSGGEAGITILGGEGVGTVTKPGLAVKVGEPAINPVPRRMIRQAVGEVLEEADEARRCEVTISVPDGVALAQKTLNQRLGIIGGLSILGTTGIVRPVSAEAWTATIRASMDVARKCGVDEVVLSTGRTSEKAVQHLLGLPEEAYAMMGDYLEFSLKEAARHGFGHVHLAAMWAKVVKAALKIPQTHVRHGALEMRQAIDLLTEVGADRDVAAGLAGSNTAREIYDRLAAMDRLDLAGAVCRRAKAYAEKVTGGIPVSVYLVNASGRVVEHV